MLYADLKTGGRLPIWMSIIIVSLTTCRFLAAYGILNNHPTGKPHPTRFYGAVGTYLLLAALSGGVLFL